METALKQKPQTEQREKKGPSPLFGRTLLDVDGSYRTEAYTCLTPTLYVTCEQTFA